MTKTLKIVIPMAGLGTRLRPQTWSRPKQLIRVAEQTIIEHVVDTFSNLPSGYNIEYIFIIGYLGDKIKTFMQKKHPEMNIRYVTQTEMKGQSHAIYLAKDYLHGPAIMVFADTLIQTDLRFLEDSDADIVGLVKPVEDPRRFGVAKVDDDGWVTRLIEKPSDVKNNLAVVGFYYFRNGENLIAAIEEQIHKDVQLKGEYFVADAINIMIEKGAKMRTHRVDTWLDAGTPKAILATNQYLLEHGHDNSRELNSQFNNVLIHPVFVHPSAKVRNSIIGPHVSIGADCDIESSIFRNTIIEDGCLISYAKLQDSLIGQHTSIEGKLNTINVGDNTVVLL